MSKTESFLHYISGVESQKLPQGHSEGTYYKFGIEWPTKDQ